MRHLPKDFRFVILHMPNGKFPQTAAAELGFTREQLETGFLVPDMGNTYSGSSPMGLAAVLDQADPGDKILLVSFGSGAGSDAFVFKATAALPKIRERAPKLRPMLDGHKRYLNYAAYARYRGKYVLND